MKNFIYKFCLFIFVGTFLACQPRIDLDLGQWGNHSDITNVLLYVYEFDDHELQEFKEFGELTPSVRKVLRSTGLEIDSENHQASVDLPAAFSLTDDVVVIAFQHTGTEIEPLNGAPVAGLPADLSNGPYTYRVYSADGSYSDWVIMVNQL